MKWRSVLLGFTGIPVVLFVVLFRQATIQTVHDGDNYYLHFFNTGLGYTEKEISAGLMKMLPPHSQMSHRDIAHGVPVAYLKPDFSVNTGMAGLFFRHACRHGLSLAPVGVGTQDTAAVIRLARSKLARTASRGHAYDYVLGRLGRGGPLAHLRSLDGVLYGRGPGSETHGAAVGATGGVFVVGLVSPLSLSVSFKKGEQEHTDTPGDSDASIEVRDVHPRLGFGAVRKDVDMFLAMLSSRYEEPGLSITGMSVLLLISDRMEESLVVLRRLLLRAGWSWSLFDMVQWRGSVTVGTGGEKGEVKRAPPADMQTTKEGEDEQHKKVLDAAIKRLEWHIADESKRDGDGGKRFRFETAALHEAQAVVAERCSHIIPLNGVMHDAFATNPRKWMQGFGKEYLINLCHWFQLDDEAYVNFERQTDGDPGGLFSLIIEEQLHQLAQEVEARLLLRANT